MNKSNSDSSSSIEKGKGHIMISYNNGSRELCLKIKDQLKEKGYSVWIDVENIYKSSLSSTTEAIENAAVILMCVSEKYYLSPNCRLEAEYAVKLQKPVIPLIMQPDYMPLGWLGVLIGGKIYYKFAGSKQSFEQTFSSMLKEINRYIDDQGLTSSSSSSNTSMSNNIKQNKAKQTNQNHLNNIITTSNPYSNNIPMINNNNINESSNKPNISNQVKYSNGSKTGI
jgi:hypothetical protein